VETPLGPFSFTFSEAGVVRCGFRLPDGPLRKGEGDLAPLVREQVSAYFSGALRLFTVPLDYGSASPFRRGVYDLVRAIPYGETRSYGEVAEALASGPRAVGQAMGGVPFPLLVPAHRVIMADGSLGGFRGRTDLKAWLLDFERGQLTKDKTGPG
jgi:methylated-DNA-[protein]-cysteine S-methyltransferase